MSVFKVMEQAGIYAVDCPVTDEDILQKAAEILLSKVNDSDVLDNPELVKRFLQYKIAPLEYEVFVVLFLNNRHKLISYEEMFRGTIDGASVYPREVVKQALSNNSAAAIIAHNHPSGVAEPSMADERITQRLKEALALVDIRLLDHLIIGDNETVSLAERGVI